MGNEDNLQKMGHADALGIAQYYGLSKTYFGSGYSVLSSEFLINIP